LISRGFLHVAYASFTSDELSFEDPSVKAPEPFAPGRCRRRRNADLISNPPGGRGTVAFVDHLPNGEAVGMTRRQSCSPLHLRPSAFAGYRFPTEVILLAVRWYLRFGLSYRDLEELLAERGIEVDHVSLYRWGNTSPRLWSTPPDAAGTRPAARWFVDETYVKVGGCLALRLPCGGPARPGDRRVRLGAPGYRRSTQVLHCRARRVRRAGGSGDGPGRRPRARDRRAATRCLPQHRAVRQQPGRVRPTGDSRRGCGRCD
jgi:hypothetical protein